MPRRVATHTAIGSPASTHDASSHQVSRSAAPTRLSTVATTTVATRIAPSGERRREAPGPLIGCGPPRRPDPPPAPHAPFGPFHTAAS